MPDVASGKMLIGDGTRYEEVAMSGDATIVSSGALTIANDAVTYGKIQNVTEANKLLGSTTAGGAVSEVTIATNMIDDLAITATKIANDAVGADQLKLPQQLNVQRGALILVFLLLLPLGFLL